LVTDRRCNDDEDVAVGRGRNVMPAENRNYKYVPWESIARTLGLEMRKD